MVEAFAVAAAATQRNLKSGKNKADPTRTCLHAVSLPGAIVILESPELHPHGIRRRERWSGADERVPGVLRAVLRRRGRRSDKPFEVGFWPAVAILRR